KRGIEYFKGIIESGKVLRLSEPQILGQFNFWYHFVVTAYSKQWDFTLSRDELADIPGTKQYQQSALAFAEELKKRFKNVSPSLFLCVSGRLIEIDIEWPHQPWAGRTASYVTVRVVDKLTNEFAYCFVAQTHQQDMFELKEDPFREYSGIANSIRKAVDSRSITFYSSPADHPNDLQRVNLTLGPTQPAATDISDFLRQKVLFMGFRSGSRDTEVWLTDPWDADYLGVTVRAFQMEAEFLEAEELVRLNDEDRSFASAAKRLLLEERARVVPAAKPRQAIVQSPSTNLVEFDDPDRPIAFMSYSWETKEHEDWVLALATRLTETGGVNVILDKWHLRMGMDKTLFMEKAVAESDFVLIICTPTYAQKANERRGGVGYEAMIITGELAQDIQQTRFIPVLREGEWDKTSMPRWLSTRTGADLRGTPYDARQYDMLVREFHREYLKPPAAGPKPDFSSVAPATSSASPAPAVQPRPLPAQNARRQNAIAHAFYETTGPNSTFFKMYVRPVDQAKDLFSLETSDGEVSEGSLSEVAQDFLLTDLKYRQEGYKRMNKGNSSGRRELDLT
ncbi:MAG: TIR domain-containing protein, partial [Candidatus Korobacteraceae bacterium]